jgi:signal transduction histidine kinase
MDLCELGRITLLSFEAPLEQKRLEVSFDAEPDSIFVFADRDAIQQVIYNLMDNAIKFTPEEGRFAIKVSVQEKKAIFSVENSGDGIPPEELSHLFDRFYKSDRSRGLDKKGMGLGLFIAKSIISAHSEEIWVESQMGRFTRFVFSLPLTNQKGRK